MARRTKEDVCPVMVDRNVHAKLREFQRLLGKRTLSDAIEHLLHVVDRAEFKSVVAATK